METGNPATNLTDQTAPSQSQTSHSDDDFLRTYAAKKMSPASAERINGIMAKAMERFSDPEVMAHAAAREARELEIEKQRTIRQRIDSLVYSGVSRRHGLVIEAIKAIDSGSWFETLQKLRKAVADGQIVGLIGARGTGKTQMAVALIDDLIGRRISRLITIGDVFRKIRATFQRNSEKSEAQVIAEYSNVHLLILDEAHERSESDFEVRALTAILDKRYGAMLPTILISNQNKQALGDSLGPSIVSRIQESGQIIECTWPSFRTSLPEELKSARDAGAKFAWNSD